MKRLTSLSYLATCLATSLAACLAVLVVVPAGARPVPDRATDGVPADLQRSSARAGTSLFGASKPARTSVRTRRATTVGVVVKTTTAGQVTALRYFKGRTNMGPHVGAVYSASGKQLVRVRFRKETARGWQKVRLASPLSVRAGQRVTVAVHMPRGHHALSRSYRWPRRAGALNGLRGVKSVGSALRRPTAGKASNNYFVDMTFKTTTAATQQSAWPDASNTGVVGCPALEKVDNGDEIQLNRDGAVFENKELMNPAIIRVLAHDVTIRCVKMNGTGYFGIDNEGLPDSPAPGADDTTIDRVEIDCQNQGQVIGILAQSATVTRANVYNCDHFLNAGGDNLVIRDNYCHDLTDLPVVHADCIQTLGGNDNMLIEHNALWSRDTSDILLGQEFGDASNVVINNNRLMSVGNPPPAYLLYLSGTNTVVTNNRFTKRFTYGACTLNTDNPVVWSGNVWDETGKPLRSCR